MIAPCQTGEMCFVAPPPLHRHPHPRQAPRTSHPVLSPPKSHHIFINLSVAFPIPTILSQTVFLAELPLFSWAPLSFSLCLHCSISLLVSCIIYLLYQRFVDYICPLTPCPHSCTCHYPFVILQSMAWLREKKKQNTTLRPEDRMVASRVI